MSDQVYSTGRRKESIARVWISNGTGNITIRTQEAGAINLQTNGNTSRLYIASGGNVGVGNQTNPESTLHVTGNMLVQNNIGNNITVRSTVNNGNDPNFVFQKARGGSGTPAIVNDNDDVGMIQWSGYDGDNYEKGAHIYAEVDGTPGDDEMPMRLIFATRKVGEGSAAGRLIIDHNGYVTTPERPYFNANGNPSLDGNNIVKGFTNVPSNNGSHYNNTNGVFTAPIAGFYWFSAGVWCSSSQAYPPTSVILSMVYKNLAGNTSTFAGCNVVDQYDQAHASAGVTVWRWGLGLPPRRVEGERRARSLSKLLSETVSAEECGRCQLQARWGLNQSSIGQR